MFVCLCISWLRRTVILHYHVTFSSLLLETQNKHFNFHFSLTELQLKTINDILFQVLLTLLCIIIFIHHIYVYVYNFRYLQMRHILMLNPFNTFSYITLDSWLDYDHIHNSKKILPLLSFLQCFHTEKALWYISCCWKYKKKNWLKVSVEVKLSIKCQVVQ